MSATLSDMECPEIGAGKRSALHKLTNVYRTVPHGTAVAYAVDSCHRGHCGDCAYALWWLICAKWPRWPRWSAIGLHWLPHLPLR